MADSGGGGRYFCHQCNVEIPRVSEDFCCPVCNSGFIEELSNSDLSEPGAPLHEPDPMDQMDFPGQLANFLPPGMLSMGMDMGRPGRYHVHRQGPMRPMLRGVHQQDGHLENFLQELIFNVTGMGVAGGGGVPGVQFHLVPGHQGAGGVQIHGHPGDYAWGTGGLDAIITQLLNQMDGSGPPPMAQENIKEIPDVNVNTVMLEKNPNCSVCWEDFKLQEPVKQLECAHCFHKDCIVPWLQLHGTCPVCRKVLSGDENQEPGNQEQAEHYDYEVQDSSSSRVEGEEGGGGAGGGAEQAIGTGGFSGFIQNAFSSILNSALQSNSADGGSTLRSSQSFSGSPSTTSTTTSGSGSRPGLSSDTGRSTTATGVSDSESSEDGTPSSRRQRLDSDLIDFDLE